MADISGTTGTTSPVFGTNLNDGGVDVGNQNLDDIAKRYGISKDDLKKANPGVNLDRLQPGMRLQLPAGNMPSPSPSASPSPTPAPTPRPGTASESALQSSLMKNQLRSLQTKQENAPADEKKTADEANPAKELSEHWEATTNILKSGKPAAEKAEKLSEFIGETQKTLNSQMSQVNQYQQQMQGLVKQFTAGKITAEQMNQGLAPLRQAQSKLLNQVEAGTSMLGEAQKAAKSFSGMAEKFAQAGESMEKYKNGTTGALLGLNIIGNYTEMCQKDPDPAHGYKNAAAAITSTLGGFKMDQALGATRFNSAGIAAGVMKFGLEEMGLKDSPAYTAVDAFSQALPSDAVQKGLTQFIDQSNAWGSFLKSGCKDTHELEDLNHRNLNGNNGMVMQGASILGDLMATGGKNVPTTGPGVEMAKSFGVYGHTDIPVPVTNPNPQNVDQEIQNQIGTLNKLMDGTYTNEEDGLKIKNILTTASPYELSHILAGIDNEKLLSSVREQNQSSMGPVAGLVQDIYNKAASTQDPGVKHALFTQIRDLTLQSSADGRTGTAEIHNLVLSGTMPQLPPDIRNAILSTKTT